MNKFPTYRVVDETENFALLYDPAIKELEKTVESFVLIYKPLESVEVYGASYAQMLFYLADAERGLQAGRELLAKADLTLEGKKLN